MAETRESFVSGWGRVADYLFGRNALIGLASLMLLAISGFATWHGMRDFIIGVSSSGPASEQLLPGGMRLSNDVLVIVVVVALTFLMWLMLRETFGARRSLRERLITFPLYVFLAVWSVGFGYGFWWSLISGGEATRTGLAGLQEDARDASAVIAARLAAVRAQLDNVVTWSDSQMTREETSGGSCGTPSGAGRGPLYNARRGVRDSVATLRDGMTRSWLEPVQADVEALKQSAGGLVGRHRRGAAEGLRGQGFRHPRPRPQHRRPQQPARQVDGGRDARARQRGGRPTGLARLLLLRPDARRAAAAGRDAGRPAGRAEAARGGVQRGAGRRGQRRQEPVAQHRRLFDEPGELRRDGWKARRGPHRQRRADHGARPDRAARHHRRRPRPARAGHSQSAERRALDQAHGRLPPADQRGDRHRDRARGRRPGMGAPAFHPSQGGVLPRDPQPLRRRSGRREGKRPRAGDEPSRRRVERSGPRDLAGTAASSSASCRSPGPSSSA